MKKTALILAVLLFALPLVSCGAFSSNYVQLSASALTIDSGSRSQITATPSSSLSGTAIVWSSDNEAIATVDSEGWVTGVAGGTAIITATAGTVSASCTVTVTGDAPVYSGGKFNTREKADGTLVITGIDGKQSTVAIPSEIDGKKVTEIGDSAFMWDEYVVTLTIPSSVKKIGENAFYYCPKLASVTIESDGENGVEEIGADAFYRCTALKSFTFPSTLKSIGDYAFEYCKLLRRVDLPLKQGSVTLGEKCFLIDPDTLEETELTYTK
ncbi:MAG: leucine-rich repeat protein [Clostridia bacterium]|nr:leucine-rich repeat protein [Clostridia bacterium]